MKVLITRELPKAGIEMLEKYWPQIQLDYRTGPPLTTKELKQAIKDVHGIIPVIPDQITAEVLKTAKDLKIVAHYAVGYDNIDLEAATKQGVYVANTPGNLTEAVAEHALALIFDITRRITAADRFVRKGKYRYWDPMLFLGPKVAGKTLGIVGFGRIGQHLAKIANKGLGMKIIYVDTKECIEMKNEIAVEKVELDFLLENSDFVSIHCNLTEETKHMFGEREFRKMKPMAYLINTARGPIIDEAALAIALREGWIEAAGLDVFEDEPKVHPDLLKLENVVLTPHIGSATREARIEMVVMAAQNIIDVLIDKKPPRNLVNKEVLAKKGN